MYVGEFNFSDDSNNNEKLCSSESDSINDYSDNNKNLNSWYKTIYSKISSKHSYFFNQEYFENWEIMLNC